MPVPDAATHTEGLNALRNLTFLQSAKYREQQSRANRKGAHPDIIDFERALVRRMRKLGVPMFAHNMVRSKAEQDALFVKGVSNAKGGLSPHNYGCAVDIVHGTAAWDIPRHAWAMIGHIGKEVAEAMGVKITWGGDWDFYDPAHWELTNWRDIGPENVLGVHERG